MRHPHTLGIDDLEKVIKRLTYRERTIIEMRYGLNNNRAHTFREIAEIMHVSTERIRQIKAKAIRKIFMRLKLKRHES